MAGKGVSQLALATIRNKVARLLKDRKKSKKGRRLLKEAKKEKRQPYERHEPQLDTSTNANQP